MSAKSFSRREFMKRSGVAAGAVSLATAARSRSILGANDRIGVGFIGVGIRGIFLVQTTQAIPGAEVRACCDLYDGHLERMKELNLGEVQLTRAYEEVLDNPDVDAVVVATPDHWHKPIVLNALAAGKDVYIEKPITHRWEDSKEFQAAVASSGQILQVGSQQASNAANEPVKELIRSGALGKITYIVGAYHRNTPTGAWYYPIPPDASEETVDWKRFLGDTRWFDYDPRRFFQWRLYWEYSGGLPTDLFVHLVTATHTLMDVQMPARVTGVAAQLQWKDYREVPDHMTALAEYEEGFILNMTATANNRHPYPMLTIMGTEGTIEYFEWGPHRYIYYPQPVQDTYWYSTHSWPAEAKRQFAEAQGLDPTSMRPLDTPKAGEPHEEKFQDDGLMRHMRAFYGAVRERKQPFEDVVFGTRAATVGHMANISYRMGRPVRWYPEREEVIW